MVEGHSTVDTEIAVISENPFACTWFQTEDRTPQVVLEANPHYWNTSRGARLERVTFLNDVSQKDAIDLVCTTEGAVDIVTNISPVDAGRVENSPFAKLVKRNAMRVVAGIINRAGNGNPLDDVRVRQALNLAIDRSKLVEKALRGYGAASAGLTPSWTKGFFGSLAPYAHNPAEAKRLLAEGGWQQTRGLKIAAANEHETLARLVAEDLRDALGITIELTVLSDAEKISELRKLAEKQIAPDWDIFVYGWSGQTVDAPPLELHYQFVGELGAFSSGKPIAVFEDLYREFTAQTSQAKQMALAHELDKFVYEHTLALFLCSPQALYAVNKEVDFTPYATTFELAETSVGKNHWSRQQTENE